MIERASELEAALAEAWRSHPEYLDSQSELFDRTFDLSDQPSSLRAAQAILSFLGGRRETLPQTRRASPMQRRTGSRV